MTESNNRKLREALKSIYDSLTEEQKEKVKNCKSMDDLTLFAGKEGIELPDEVLDAVAGGYINETSDYLGWWVWDENGNAVDDRPESERLTYQSREAAIATAKRHGVSTEEINFEQWCKLTGNEWAYCP